MPTSRLTPRPDHGRRGFSLLEILVVLAIFAIATAVILPSTSRMLDQATSHAVFFEFQRQVFDLRREANRTGVAVRIIDPQMQIAENGDRTLSLRRPWRYTLAPTLAISEGGTCSVTSANLIRGEVVIMTLRSDGASCRFIRVVPAAARKAPPPSR